MNTYWTNENIPTWLTEEEQKKYSQMRKLVLMWVSNKSQIAQTIWISRNTVYNWLNYLNIEFSNKISESNRISELWKIMAELDLVNQEAWKMLKDWDDKSSSNIKKNAVSIMLQVIKMKADLMWFSKDYWMFLIQSSNIDHREINMNIYNYYAELLWWSAEELEKRLKNWEWLIWWKTIAEIVWIPRL